MFAIKDKTIHLTRGDVATIQIAATNGENAHTFNVGDVIRLRVFKRKDYESVVLQKEVVVETETQTVEIFLSKEDTKIGGIINDPIDFWYEIELNPNTMPQTIIGHDATGAKIFKIYPEGADV